MNKDEALTEKEQNYGQIFKVSGPSTNFSFLVFNKNESGDCEKYVWCSNV